MLAQLDDGLLINKEILSNFTSNNDTIINIANDEIRIKGNSFFDINLQINDNDFVNVDVHPSKEQMKLVEEYKEMTYNSTIKKSKHPTLRIHFIK